jgi:hypothetical protein
MRNAPFVNKSPQLNEQQCSTTNEQVNKINNNNQRDNTANTNNNKQQRGN